MGVFSYGQVITRTYSCHLSSTDPVVSGQVNVLIIHRSLITISIITTSSTQNVPLLSWVSITTRCNKVILCVALVHLSGLRVFLCRKKKKKKTDLISSTWYIFQGIRYNLVISVQTQGPFVQHWLHPSPTISWSHYFRVLPGFTIYTHTHTHTHPTQMQAHVSTRQAHTLVLNLVFVLFCT